MKYARALSLAFFFGSLSLIGQSPAGQEPSHPAVLKLVPLQNSCPIDMRVQQGTNGMTVSVGQSRPQGIAQLLHITMTNSKAVGVVAAQVTVHGFTAKGRVAPAEAVQSDPMQTTKTLNLDLRVGAKQDASTDLWVRAFTAVSFIDLDSVTFADGSSWHSSENAACHVALDGLMLISSR